MGHYKRIQRVNLTATVNPKVIRGLEELLKDSFYKSRSQAIEQILAEHLLENEYIDDSEFNDIINNRTKYQELEDSK